MAPLPASAPSSRAGKRSITPARSPGLPFYETCGLSASKKRIIAAMMMRGKGLLSRVKRSLRQIATVSLKTFLVCSGKVGSFDIRHLREGKDGKFCGFVAPSKPTVRSGRPTVNRTSGRSRLATFLYCCASRLKAISALYAAWLPGACWLGGHGVVLESVPIHHPLGGWADLRQGGWFQHDPPRQITRIGALILPYPIKAMIYRLPFTG